MFIVDGEKPAFWSASAWILALGVGVIATVIGGIYVIDGIRASNARFAQIDHTYQIITKTQELLSVLTDAETGQRGYIVTHDRTFLEPYDAAGQRIPGVFEQLSALTADSPQQETRVDELRRLSDLKMAELNGTVTLASAGDYAAAADRVREGTGKRYMDQIRGQIDQITGAEENLLTLRQRELNDEQRSNLIAIVVFVGIAALLIVLAVVIASFIRKANLELERIVTERTRELRESHAERLGLLDKLTNTQEEEQKRIGQDVHDQLGQIVTGLRLNLQALSNDGLGERKTKDVVRSLVDQANTLDSEVSFLSWMLRPAILDELGLVPALNALIDQWSRHFGVEADFEAFDVADDVLNRDTEVRLFRIVQEALTNCAKHAEASTVSVVLKQGRDTLDLIIEDDGCGFDPSGHSSPAQGTHGIGLGSMRDRARLLGADFEIESANGSGTTIYVRVPLRKGVASKPTTGLGARSSPHDGSGETDQAP